MRRVTHAQCAVNILNAPAVWLRTTAVVVDTLRQAVAWRFIAAEILQTYRYIDRDRISLLRITAVQQCQPIDKPRLSFGLYI